MLKKNVRLRKEYLLRKSKEEQEKQKYEKKRKLRESERGPTELSKRERILLHHEAENEDLNTQTPNTHIDDEYEEANFTEAKILITSSRDPPQRLTQFVKELRLIIPNCVRMNRGKYILSELVKICEQHEFTDLIIAHAHHGEPDGLIISHFPHGPTAFFGLTNVILRHDLPKKAKNMSQQFPHLIFNNFSTTLGERVSDILKHLFPQPKIDSRRILAFVNDNDYILFRHYNYSKEVASSRKIDLEEIGPRFDMKPFQINLGTLENTEASTEWALTSYINTAKKSKLF